MGRMSFFFPNFTLYIGVMCGGGWQKVAIAEGNDEGMMVGGDMWQDKKMTIYNELQMELQAACSGGHGLCRGAG